MYGWHEEDRVATVSEAVREWVWNVGQDYPDRQWLWSDYDTCEQNPHYKGPPQPYPGDGIEDEYDLAPEADKPEWQQVYDPEPDFDEIPF